MAADGLAPAAGNPKSAAGAPLSLDGSDALTGTAEGPRGVFPIGNHPVKPPVDRIRLCCFCTKTLIFPVNYMIIQMDC